MRTARPRLVTAASALIAAEIVVPCFGSPNVVWVHKAELLRDTLTCCWSSWCLSTTSVRSLKIAANSLILASVLPQNFCLWNRYSSKLPQFSFTMNADLDFCINSYLGELVNKEAIDFEMSLNFSSGVCCNISTRNTDNLTQNIIMSRQCEINIEWLCVALAVEKVCTKLQILLETHNDQVECFWQQRLLQVHNCLLENYFNRNALHDHGL